MQDFGPIVAVSDPNWFFSTLSQSAAAIVGILGGFFVSRLLQHLPDVRRSRDGVIQTFLTVRESTRSRRDSLVQFCTWGDSVRPLVEQAVTAGQTQIPVNHHVSISGGGGSGGD
jgi:hypothetical protein